MTDVKLSAETNHITTFDGTERIRAVEDVSTVPATGYIESGQFVLSDGWTPVNEAWTYNAVDKFNAPTDAATRYQKGDKLRWKQGGAYKYGCIIAVASALITIAVNTDYTVANSAITDIAISRSENPTGWPEWFGFTTVVSSQAGTITSYTVYLSRFRISAKTIEYKWEVTIVNNGTGADCINVTVPTFLSYTNVGAGREISMTGKQLSVTLPATATTAIIFNYDNTYPGGTGYVLMFSVSGEY